LPNQEQIHADKLGVSNQQILRGVGITLRYRDYTIDQWFPTGGSWTPRGPKQDFEGPKCDFRRWEFVCYWM